MRASGILIILCYLCCIQAFAGSAEKHDPSQTAKDRQSNPPESDGSGWTSEFDLGPVVVSGYLPENGIAHDESGDISLESSQFKNTARFLGVNDMVRMLQLTPGVQVSGEGNSGLFVRGGETGHNLVLYDNAPVFNPMHLLGFFSVFNNDHIEQISLSKSYIPPGYGGRLSSVVTVATSDSVARKFSVSGNVGIVAAQATANIPFSAEQSLRISVRQTYLGLLVGPMIKKMSATPDDTQPFDYEFTEFNATYNAKLSDRDRLKVNFYIGNDNFKISEAQFQLQGKLRWTNVCSSVDWQRQASERLTIRNTIYVSSYSNRFNNFQGGFHTSLPSSVTEAGYRGEAKLRTGKVDATAGISYSFRGITPQYPTLRIDNIRINKAVDNRYLQHELATHADLTWNVARGFTIEGGVRFSAAFTRDRGGNDKSGGSFAGIEPRAAARYHPGDKSSLLLAYGRQRQYLHLISISAVGFPTDFWIPAMKGIGPESSDNFSLTYMQSIAGGRWSVSSGLFYKNMSGLTEYKLNLMDFYNKPYVLQQSVSTGKGEAWGAELMLSKNSGALRGWVSYTLSRSLRRFPEIDNGAAFPAASDRPHSLSANLTYRINDKWHIASTFVYATGSPFSQPTGYYLIDGCVVKEWGSYNNARLPDYKRLDLSVTYWFRRDKDRENGINLSVYNALCAENPMYIFYVVKSVDFAKDRFEIMRNPKSLYTIIPSISWIFKF